MNVAYPVVDVFLQLRRPRGSRAGAPEQLRAGPRHDGQRLQRRGLRPDGGLRPDADPKQHASHPGSAQRVPSRVHGRLVSDIWYVVGLKTTCPYLPGGVSFTD